MLSQSPRLQLKLETWKSGEDPDFGPTAAVLVRARSMPAPIKARDAVDTPNMQGSTPRSQRNARKAAILPEVE
jgi:hypothetical protein